ncbi:Ribosomal RNA small subunit methyltransferase G [Moorella humiferrea]|uniref:16S rRNA (guanine(527)-N(7))-methyltransferase RsmG n=1 Tax=Neomoorella humiferrea TaxID=676965 RepID=UPI0030D24578
MQVSFKEKIKEMLAGIEINLTDRQVETIKSYIDMLLETNREMNLTAINEEGEIWRKHVIDSLLVFCAAEISSGARVIDVGSGAGIPGIILKIYRPDLNLTLLEAQRKKIIFQEEAVAKLGLKNIKCLWSRAEEAGRLEEHREKYDVAVARAVAPLNILVEYCLPLVKVGGLMIAYKGPSVDEELKAAEKAIAILGGGQPEVWRGHLPGGEEERRLIKIKKSTKTPTNYPRRAGVPARKPLK